MVSSEKRDLVGVAHLQHEKQRKCFDGIDTTIDEVSQEHKVRGGSFVDVATDAEELEEVHELAVDVATDRSGTADTTDVGFLDENFNGLTAEETHFAFTKSFTGTQLFLPFGKVGHFDLIF